MGLAFIFPAGFLQSRSSPDLPNVHVRVSVILCNLTSQLVRLLQYAVSFTALLDNVVDGAPVRHIHAWPRLRDNWPPAHGPQLSWVHHAFLQTTTGAIHEATVRVLESIADYVRRLAPLAALVADAEPPAATADAVHG